MGLGMDGGRPAWQKNRLPCPTAPQNTITIVGVALMSSYVMKSITIPKSIQTTEFQYP